MSNVYGFGNLPPNQRDHPNRSRRLAPIGAFGRQEDRRPDPNDDNDAFGGFGNIMPNEPLIEDQLRLANEHKVLFISGSRALKDPREQSYYNMLVFSFCPNFSFLSVTFLIILANIVMFIVEVVKGLDKASQNLLQVKISTLIQLGANYQPNDLAGQVYRFLSAIFLHINFIHIFGNTIATFLFLSRVQHTFGPVKTLVIYLLSGITANVFSVLLSKDSVKAGASTSLYGIIGVIIGYIVINWRGLDLLGPMLKCQVWCSAMMIIMFIFLFTPTSVNDNIDWAGHLGGVIAGLFLSCLGPTIVDNTRQRVFRIVFGILFLVMVLVCFLVFYLTQEPVGQVL